MISAQEARAAGPIADYIAVSRALQDQIWKAIYARQTSMDLKVICQAVGMDYDSVSEYPWFNALESELEALGYGVSAEGVVSW